jgi:hypothetical protein
MAQSTVLRERNPERSAEAARRADLLRLRSLLEREDIAEARRFVARLVVKWPECERVRHFAEVLAPPRSRALPSPPDRPLDEEYAWLRDHAREYPGQWLAVRGARLVAADPAVGKVLSVIRDMPGADDALLHYEL